MWSSTTISSVSSSFSCCNNHSKCGLPQLAVLEKKENEVVITTQNVVFHNLACARMPAFLVVITTQNVVFHNYCGTRHNSRRVVITTQNVVFHNFVQIHFYRQSL